MCKVEYFTALMQCVIADKINAWLLKHPGYRVAAMSIIKNSDGYCSAWVAFETV